MDLRLEAVLFADVAGYSRLVALNEAEALGLVDRCLAQFQPAGARFGGRLIKTTGDGAVMVFPSSVSAVECALALQETLADVNSGIDTERAARFRMGVHLGEVQHSGADIYGNAVNITARLQEFAEPDGICMSEIVYAQVRSRVKAGFQRLGPQKLKNIPDAIEIYRLNKNLDAAAFAPSIRPGGSRLSLPDRPSIAVLPFSDQSPSTSFGLLTDGITEEIIANLSRYQEIFVISQGSSLALRGQGMSIADVGRTFGVQYVLEGAVWVLNGATRITSKLIDTVRGRHLWSENYTKATDKVISVVEEVTRQITAALVTQVEMAEAQRGSTAQTSDFTAYHLFLRGREASLQISPSQNAEARQLFKEATAIDPDYARAHAAIARTYNYDWQFGWGPEPDRGLDKALERARKALRLDRRSPFAMAELGFALLYKKQYSSAVAQLRSAHKLNPNDPDIMIELAAALYFTRALDEALEMLETAMRLNPYYPDRYLWYLADARYAVRDFDGVIDAVNSMTNPGFGARLMAATYAHIGNAGEAGAWAQEVLRLQPDFSIADWAHKQPDIDPAETAHLIEGLRKAGLPE